MGIERHWPVSQYAPCKHELHNSVYLEVSSLGHHELPWLSRGANFLRILNAGKISLSVSGIFSSLSILKWQEISQKCYSPGPGIFLLCIQSVALRGLNEVCITFTLSIGF